MPPSSPARVVPPLLVALFALSACTRHGPERTLSICGVNVNTDAQASIAVVAESTTGGGALAYAILGETGGRLQVGASNKEPVLLRLAVDAEVWITDAAGKTYQVESPGRGLAAAGVDRSTIELRGDKANAKLPVSPGETVDIGYDGAMTVSHHK